jgi:hypothetical protein
VQKELQCELGQGWRDAYAGVFTVSRQNGIDKTNETQEWGYTVSDSVPHVGAPLPEIRVSITNRSLGWPLFALQAKSENPHESLIRLAVVPIFTDAADILKPFIIVGHNESSGVQWVSPEEISNNFITQVSTLGAKPKISMVLDASKAPKTDFIDGTDVTHEELEKIFPFGYAVFYLNDKGQIDTHEFRNNLANWKIDWSSVKIEPNFSSVIVRFTMPEVDANPGTGSNLKIQVNNGLFIVDLQLKKGAIRPIGLMLGGNPVPYVAVLSDNERKPVFAIGFRIPTPDL